MKKMDFGKDLIILGFGSIGKGVLPLILRHIDVDPSRIAIIAADECGKDIARINNVSYRVETLTPGNYRDVLLPLLKKDCFLLNLSVNVSSYALVELCQEIGALYLDTCIEPWEGGYTDPNLSLAQRTNYALREEMLKLKKGPGSATAVITHGANPGLVSHLIKKALLDIAKDTGFETDTPSSKEGWAMLMRDLGVKAIHIAERDTQIASSMPKKIDEFVNTWSVDGFIGEGMQPSELGWGTHEKSLPDLARRHETGKGAAIYIARPGAGTRVRSWAPIEGPFNGFLITHNESISTADFYTVWEGDKPVYRPTVHYAYHPCDDAVLSLHELSGRNWVEQSRSRLMMDEITSGIDELGVLLMGHAKGAYWYGSQLSVQEARSLAPQNNATSLQVTAAVLGGVMWAIANPNQGVVEPEEMDFEYVLKVASPYLGPVVGAYTNWTPLVARGKLFPEKIDETDPWQFNNILVQW